MGVSVQSEEVTRLLDRIGIWVGPAGMRKLLRRLTNYQLQSSMDNFDIEGFDGQPWPALEAVTADAKITQDNERGYDNILHPTGTHLLQTLSTEVTESSGRVFTPCPWAHVHNEGASLEGTAFGDIEIPARTFLAIGEMDEQEHLLIVGDFMEHDMFGG